MKKQILDNILEVKQKKVYGKIIKPLGSNKWLVRDTQGRTLEADSDILWAIGSGVTVRDGFITGKASTIVKRKVFQV